MIIPFIIYIACIIGWSITFIQFVRGKYKPDKSTIGFLFLMTILGFASFAIQFNPFGGTNQ